jgi:hypothetical protein
MIRGTAVRVYGTDGTIRQSSPNSDVLRSESLTSVTRLVSAVFFLALQGSVWVRERIPRARPRRALLRRTESVSSSPACPLAQSPSPIGYLIAAAAGRWKGWRGLVSGAEELQPRVLSEPYVNLSIHTAPAVQPALPKVAQPTSCHSKGDLLSLRTCTCA